MSGNGSIDRNRMLRYILGQELEPGQDERIEQAYFQDEAFLRDMEALEDELVDQYVMGELTPDTRELVLGKIETSERWRQKYELAERLRRFALEEEPSGAASRAGRGFGAWWTGAGARSRLAWVLASAALAIVVGLWTWYRWAPGPGPAEPVTESAGPPESPTPRTIERKLPVVTVLLASPPVRGREAATPKITLPAGDCIVELKIWLGIQTYDRYRAEAKAVDGTPSPIQGGMEVRVEMSPVEGHTLWVRMPSEALPAGRYALSLEGSTTGTGWQTVGTYPFEALPR